MNAVFRAMALRQKWVTETSSVSRWMIQKHTMLGRCCVCIFLSLQINDFETEERYSRMLRQLLDDHSNVVTHLADGFKESRKYLKVRK